MLKTPADEIMDYITCKVKYFKAVHYSICSLTVLGLGAKSGCSLQIQASFTCALLKELVLLN